VKFIIRGKEFDLTKQQILMVLEKEEPKKITKYYIEIGEKQYPIKQVIELATGLHLVDFTSMDANHVLLKLGFVVQSIS